MTPLDPYKAEHVVGHPFTQETVQLDGKVFRDCTFTHCTLVFAGSQPFLMPGCRFDNVTLAVVGDAGRALTCLAAAFDDAAFLAMLADIREQLPPID